MTPRQYITIERHSVVIEPAPLSDKLWWIAHYTDRDGATRGFGGVTSQEAQDKARADILARLSRQEATR